MKWKKWVIIFVILLIIFLIIFNYNNGPFTEYLVEQKAISVMRKAGTIDISQYNFKITDRQKYWEVSVQLNLEDERNKDAMGGTTYILISKFFGKIIDVIHR